MDFIKGLLEREAARIATWAAAAATAAALALAAQLGVELTAEVVAAVGAIAWFVTSEVIRRLVFSIKTTQEIANNSTYLAAGTPVDIGNPPEGPTPGQAGAPLA